MTYSYSIYARKYFSNFVNNKDLLLLASNMDEVFNNIFDHSNSLIDGYIITQYYPKNKKLSFSVCDFGIGIPRSIEGSIKNRSDEIEDWKMILTSLERGTSSNSNPRNRGFGLNNILSLTESKSGRLKIISNKGKVEKSAGGMYLSGANNYDFSGTLIKVEVNLELFDERDNTDQIFDF